MSAKIRLMRMGKKGHPIYRIIVIDEQKKQISRYLEKLGNYDPALTEKKITLDQSRFDFWKKQGAQLSKGLAKLLKAA
jgi:small subunit ribosomal protein S16